MRDAVRVTWTGSAADAAATAASDLGQDRLVTVGPKGVVISPASPT